jgi:hypothetical protein
MRNETRLAAYLDQRRVSYLITFPDIYPALTRTAPVIFTSGGRFALAAGETNMAIYRWNSP